MWRVWGMSCVVCDMYCTIGHAHVGFLHAHVHLHAHVCMHVYRSCMRVMPDVRPTLRDLHDERFE